MSLKHGFLVTDLFLQQSRDFCFQNLFFLREFIFLPSLLTICFFFLYVHHLRQYVDLCACLMSLLICFCGPSPSLIVSPLVTSVTKPCSVCAMFMLEAEIEGKVSTFRLLMFISTLSSFNIAEFRKRIKKKNINQLI